MESRQVTKVWTRHKVEMVMVFTFAGLWLVGELIFQLVIPQYYFHFYPVIPVLFIFFSLINTNCIRRWERALDAGTLTRAKVFNYFMVGKSIKLVVCLTIMICYVNFVRVQNTVFLMVFLLYYVLFLVYETIAQQSFEKRQKLRLEQNDPI